MSPPAHVFVVHSGITGLVAEGVVRTLSLEAAQVAAIHARGRWPVLEDAVALELTEKVPNASLRAAGDARRAAGRLRGRVTELVGGQDFLLYVPQLDETTYRLIAAHPSCRGVNYLEEGLLSFEPRPTSSFARLRHPGTLRRVAAGITSYGMLGRYGIASAVAEDWFPGWRTATFFHASADAFLWAPNRVRIELSVGPRLDGYPDVIVVQDLIEQLGIPLDGYCQVLRRLSRVLASRGHATVAVKFHPQQGPLGRSEIMGSLAVAGILVEALPDRIVLERLLTGRTAVGLASSALRYAELLGGRAYTIADLIPGGSPAEVVMRSIAARVSGLPGARDVPPA